MQNCFCIKFSTMLICAPIQEKTQKMALKRLSELKNKADLAEVWLDHIKDLDIKELLKKAPSPVLCVCKKPSEKGLFNGNYSQMADILIKALEFGAKYVDLPIGMPKNLSKKCIQYCQKSNVKSQMSKVIISYHDFKKTPSISSLLKKARDMKKRGADIVKIAVTANSIEDTFSIIFLAQAIQSENIPHILIAMGKKGILSRVITPFLGGTIMFAPLTKNQASASGQLTVDELKKVWGMIKLH